MPLARLPGYVVADSPCCGRNEYRVDQIITPVTSDGRLMYGYVCRLCEASVLREATAQTLAVLGAARIYLAAAAATPVDWFAPRGE